MILLILLLILIFGLGGGYWGNNQWGQNVPWAGPGVGLGMVLIVVLIIYMLGGFRNF